MGWSPLVLVPPPINLLFPPIPLVVESHEVSPTTRVGAHQGQVPPPQSAMVKKHGEAARDNRCSTESNFKSLPFFFFFADPAVRKISWSWGKEMNTELHQRLWNQLAFSHWNVFLTHDTECEVRGIIFNVFILLCCTCFQDSSYMYTTILRSAENCPTMFICLIMQIIFSIIIFSLTLPHMLVP